MFLKYFILLVLLAMTAGAQKFEVGGLGGGGGFGAEDVSGTYWIAGAEACFFCNRKAALFAEYNHYGLSSGRTVISSADLVSGGLRLQRAKSAPTSTSGSPADKTISRTVRTISSG